MKFMLTSVVLGIAATWLSIQVYSALVEVPAAGQLTSSRRAAREGTGRRGGDEVTVRGVFVATPDVAQAITPEAFPPG